jgi:hypothetical protein
MVGGMHHEWEAPRLALCVVPPYLRLHRPTPSCFCSALQETRAVCWAHPGLCAGFEVIAAPRKRDLTPESERKAATPAV